MCTCVIASAKDFVKMPPAVFSGVVSESVDESPPRGTRCLHVPLFKKETHKLAHIEIRQLRNIRNPSGRAAPLPEEEKLVPEVEIDVQRAVPGGRRRHLVMNDGTRLVED